ncbi:MAG: hypothetical protein ACE5D8_02465 [Fidelibacterota bacterium]
MIDWPPSPSYFPAMRRIITPLLTMVFWACPGTTTDPIPNDPLTEQTFTFLQSTNQLYFAVTVKSPLAGGRVDSVWVDWYGKDTANVADHFMLNDSGLAGDIIIGDNIWSRKVFNQPGSLTNVIAATDSGVIYLRFGADFGTQVATVTDSFYLGNLTPNIVSVTVPDTIIRPTSGYQLYLITCTVQDANGLDDIRWVGFRSYNTVLDSFMNNGNYIYLYDDGSQDTLYLPDITSGDVTAGDGIYSFRALVSSGSTAGVYDWIFEAQDAAYAFSDTVIRRVVVQ